MPEKCGELGRRGHRWFIRHRIVANTSPDGEGGGRRRVEKLLTDILVCEFMGEPNALRLVFDRLSIDNGYFELFYDGLVNCVTLRRYCLVSDFYLTPHLMPRARLVRLYAGARLLPLRMKLTKSSTVHFVERSTTGAV